MDKNKAVYILTGIPTPEKGDLDYPGHSRSFGMFEDVNDIIRMIETSPAHTFHECYYTYLVIERYSLNQYSPISETFCWYEIDKDNDWRTWIRLEKAPERFENTCNFAM